MSGGPALRTERRELNLSRRVLEVPSEPVSQLKGRPGWRTVVSRAADERLVAEGGRQGAAVVADAIVRAGDRLRMNAPRLSPPAPSCWTPQAATLAPLPLLDCCGGAVSWLRLLESREGRRGFAGAT
jgi:hypothetical protein